MTTLMALWLPILVSAVLVFIVSSVIHMVLPWHRSDYPKLPNEDQARAALRGLKLAPGDYMMPRAMSSKDMNTPEFQNKMKEGPVAVITVMPNGPTALGNKLFMWFIYSIVVSVFAAYVAGRSLPPGAEYMAVFRLTSIVSFVGYALALWQMTIWYGRGVALTVRSTIDGLVYALATAGAFGWLWPEAVG